MKRVVNREHFLLQTSILKSNRLENPKRGCSFAELQVLSDEQLMLHVSAGHYDALGVLFDRYHRLILSIGFKILRDPGEAEDLAQSVFLECYRVAEQYDPRRGSTKTWLLQYVYHRSINRRRYLLRRDFYGTSVFEEASNRAQLDRASGEGAFSGVEARKMLGAALPELTTAQRRTIEMAYFEGWTVGEISEKTGESVVSVRHHHYRGLRRLRDLIAEKRAKKTAKERRGSVGAKE
jgi:RNA polymerase sigma-70 factor (ECF subfamily)